MDKPFILITGDDSIQAEGTILIKRMIEDFAEYQIIATKEQQSATGTSIKFPGGNWGKELVDGVEAIWVDGNPADAIYFAFDYLQQKPDLVVSGVNFGENLTNTTHTSGTVGAALIAAQRRSTPAIAFSIRKNGEEWFKEHNGDFDEQALKYPGELVRKIIKSALSYQMPKQTFWNVNFPVNETDTIKVVPTSHLDFWLNNQNITDDGKYVYKYDTNENEAEIGSDLYEVNHNHATITPFKIEYTDFNELENLKNLFG